MLCHLTGWFLQMPHLGRTAPCIGVGTGCAQRPAGPWREKPAPEPNRVVLQRCEGVGVAGLPPPPQPLRRP